MEANKEKVACYLNGLRPSIQEELILVRKASIEDAYQFALQIEENLKKKFDGRKTGHIQGGRGDVGHLEAEMRTRRKMKMWVPTETRGMMVSIAPMIKTLEIREEEVEDVDKVQEEEASVISIFIAIKKIIIPTNALNANEGHI